MTIAQQSCRVCGSTDLATRNSRGRVVTRPYCKKHWLEFSNNRRHEKERIIRESLGLDDTWKHILNEKRKPTPGYDRIVINERRRIVTMYSKGFYKSFHYEALKRLNSPDKILDFYSGIGYNIISEYSCMIVLERPIQMRARQKIINQLMKKVGADGSGNLL